MAIINHEVVLNEIAQQICDCLFGNPADSILTGYMETIHRNSPSFETLNNNFPTFIKDHFYKQISICTNRFTRKCPNILTTQTFEWYFISIARLPFFLYHALCCVDEDEIPHIFEKYPQLKKQSDQIRRFPPGRLERVSLIKNICFSSFGIFNKLHCLAKDDLASVADLLIFLLPYIGYLLEKCIHPLTRYQLLGLTHLLMNQIPKPVDGIVCFKKMICELISIFNCKEHLDLPEECVKIRSFYSRLPEKSLLKYMTNDSYQTLAQNEGNLLGPTTLFDLFLQFCNPHGDMYTLAVSHFNQEKPHFLYLTDISQPVTRNRAYLSNSGGSMTVALSDDTGKLAFYPLPFFEMHEKLQPDETGAEMKDSHWQVEGNALNRIDRFLDSIANQLLKLHYQVSQCGKHLKKRLTLKCIPTKAEYLKGFNRFIEINRKQKGNNYLLGEGFNKLNFSISNCKAAKSSDKVADEAFDQLLDCVPDYLFLKEKILQGCDANGFQLIKMLEIKLKECLFETYRWTIEINQNPPTGLQQTTTIDLRKINVQLMQDYCHRVPYTTSDREIKLNGITFYAFNKIEAIIGNPKLKLPPRRKRKAVINTNESPKKIILASGPSPSLFVPSDEHPIIECILRNLSEKLVAKFTCQVNFNNTHGESNLLERLFKTLLPPSNYLAIGEYNSRHTPFNPSESPSLSGAFSEETSMEIEEFIHETNIEPNLQNFSCPSTLRTTKNEQSNPIPSGTPFKEASKCELANLLNATASEEVKVNKRVKKHLEQKGFQLEQLLTNILNGEAITELQLEELESIIPTEPTTDPFKPQIDSLPSSSAYDTQSITPFQQTVAPYSEPVQELANPNLTNEFHNSSTFPNNLGLSTSEYQAQLDLPYTYRNPPVFLNSTIHKTPMANKGTINNKRKVSSTEFTYNGPRAVEKSTFSSSPDVKIQEKFIGMFNQNMKNISFLSAATSTQETNTLSFNTHPFSQPTDQTLQKANTQLNFTLTLPTEDSLIKLTDETLLNKRANILVSNVTNDTTDLLNYLHVEPPVEGCDGFTSNGTPTIPKSHICPSPDQETKNQWNAITSEVFPNDPSLPVE